MYVGFPGGFMVKNAPDSSGYTRDTSSIPGSAKSPGEENGNPLQYSCLENSRDRGAWQATVHGILKSQTQPSDWACTHKGKLYSPFVIGWVFFSECQALAFFIDTETRSEGPVTSADRKGNASSAVSGTLSRLWLESAGSFLCSNICSLLFSLYIREYASLVFGETAWSPKFIWGRSAFLDYFSVYLM